MTTEALDHVYNSVSALLGSDYTRAELRYALSRLLDDVAALRDDRPLRFVMKRNADGGTYLVRA